MSKKAFFSRLDLERFMLEHEQSGPQLPQGQLRMLDRVVELTEHDGRYRKGSLVAEFDLSPQHWFFSCHFPGDPVMPGCLALDGLWQSLGFYLAWRGHHGKARAIGVDTVRFFDEISPQAGTVQYRIHVRRIMQRDITLGIGDGEVWVNGREVYRAENLRVALFKTEAASVFVPAQVECA
jgi:3-hydroxyacyl-[acyl-carrier protein] dehydratase/trans-2-decenoyl-[acyl-carrier protein] isomerase